jgi:putative membrane protein
MKKILRYYLIGLGMGSADIVPGVSGGTIAFITGIYHKLIGSIKLLSTDGLKLLWKWRIREFVQLVPWSFLVPVLGGGATAILLLSGVLEYLFATFPVLIWAFFFGLVAASIFVVGRKVQKWQWQGVVSFVLGSVIAFWIVGLLPMETPAHPLAFFVAGGIAICAMILPGISGSFLLLIMGKYEQILSAVVSRDIVTLALVTGGAVVGLALFSRVLHWLFAKYHDLTVTFLAGFLLGSLRKLWPWKETLEFYVDRHGELVPLVERNIWPMVDVMMWQAIGLMILGVAIVVVLEVVMRRETSELD